MYEETVKYLFDNILFIESNELKDFIINNRIIGTSIGVIMAYAASDLIKSLVGDIVMPSLFFLFYYTLLSPVLKMKLAKGYKIDVFNFIKHLLSFFLVLIITYIIIKYVVINWFGISYMQSQQGQPGSSNTGH